MNTHKYPENLARALVRDELFDLTLYRRFRVHARGPLADMLDELIIIEGRHVQFWQQFFHIPRATLGIVRRGKLILFTYIGRIFGEAGMHLILESIEVHGVRKYLRVWETYKGTPLEEAVRRVLEDELKHEDEAVTAIIDRRVDSERIRVIFLGFNDGLVELLGAVSGFFAALGSVPVVLIAGFTVAVAGSLSMAAGVFVASGSEQEVEETERRKAQFLGQETDGEHNHLHPVRGAVTVGVAYFIGALVPMLPVFFGGTTMIWSVVASAVMIIIVSWILSFVSGMRTTRRIVTNLGIIAVTVTVTYGLATLITSIFGIQFS